MGFFKGLYEYRELLKTSISKDVRGKTRLKGYGRD